MQDPTTDESILLCDRCRAVIPKYTGPVCDDFLVKHRVSGTLEESEIHHISRTIEESDLEIQRYDTEIHRLRQTLSRLEKEWCAAIRSRNVRKALLSPIRKLPVELLCDVFSLCSHAPDEDVTKTYAVDRRKADKTSFMSVGILNIASTCALWRAVSMSRPSLWSDITICLDSLYDTVLGYLELAEVLEIWLCHSGTSPLTLRLHIYGPSTTDEMLPDPSNFHCRIERVLDSLLLESCRWESAVISMDASSVMYMYYSRTTATSFPKLQKLALSFDSNDSEMVNNWLEYLYGPFVSAPLHQLALPTSDFGPEDLFGTPAAATSLASLTSLTFDIFYRDSIPLLGHFPVLEHLRILRYKGGFGDSVIVWVEQLLHLDICIGVPDHEPPIFEPDIFAFLKAPCLVSLDISKHSYEYIEALTTLQWSSTAFRKMLDQSAFSLQSLSISEIALRNDQILEVLNVMPKLSHLTVTIDWQNPYDPSALFQALTVNPASGLQLTHLEHLLIFTPNLEIDTDILSLICDMLESRNHPLTSTSESTIQSSTNQSLTKSTYNKDKNTFPCPLIYFKLVGSHTKRLETSSCMSRFQYLAGLPGRDYSFEERSSILSRTQEALTEISSTPDEE
ncbi:hypothetical protein K435DRAFT_967009 [Dendrothele bispora CBS 962.96]|uniref:Uncharacterized protein n=1 Tax=Dendrothele bispora (strain CBS 962.96) TaxID=1314807 RepID=A0A4S8LWQ0_DENBC|nr:hypothetical protein K435DRAFT_967009 [Dendrothele bispora CBS 962.96]